MTIAETVLAIVTFKRREAFSMMANNQVINVTVGIAMFFVIAAAMAHALVIFGASIGATIAVGVATLIALGLIYAIMPLALVLFPIVYIIASFAL